VPLGQQSPARIAAEVVSHLSEEQDSDGCEASACFTILVPFEHLRQSYVILEAVTRGAPDHWIPDREANDYRANFRVTFRCRVEASVSLGLERAGYTSLLLEDYFGLRRQVEKTVCIMVWTGNIDDAQSDRFTMVGAVNLNPVQQHIWDNAVQLEGERELTELLRSIQDGGCGLNEPQDGAQSCFVPAVQYVLDKPGR
jgi:hypothetical protein